MLWLCTAVEFVGLEIAPGQWYSASENVNTLTLSHTRYKKDNNNKKNNNNNNCNAQNVHDGHVDRECVSKKDTIHHA